MLFSVFHHCFTGTNKVQSTNKFESHETCNSRKKNETKNYKHNAHKHNIIKWRERERERDAKKKTITNHHTVAMHHEDALEQTKFLHFYREHRFGIKTYSHGIWMELEFGRAREFVQQIEIAHQMGFFVAL